jgi:hypothetical protein
MSQLTHIQPQAVRLRVPLWVALAVLALVAAATIGFFALSADDKVTQTPATAVSEASPGVRYDGGPEEGSRGLVRPDAPAGIRYDGGPDEGSRGIRHPGAVAAPATGHRYDGGPEEGSRGLGR